MNGWLNEQPSSWTYRSESCGRCRAVAQVAAGHVVPSGWKLEGDGSVAYCGPCIERMDAEDQAHDPRAYVP